MNPGLDAHEPCVCIWNGLGDHILALPAIRAVAKIFDGRLSLLSLPGVEETFFGDVTFRACSILSAIGSGRDFRIDDLSLGKALRQYDLLLVLNRAWSAVFAGVNTIGFFPESTVQIPFYNQKHSFDQAFEVARYLNPALTVDDFSSPVYLPPAAREFASNVRAFLPRGMRILAVHADTAEEKMWDVSRLRRVLEHFLQTHPEFVVWVLGRTDSGLKPGPNPRRMFLFFGISLQESMALLEMADIFLGVDSCLSHAADLLRIPSVGLFNKASRREFGFRFCVHNYVPADGELVDASESEVAGALQWVLESVGPGNPVNFSAGA